MSDAINFDIIEITNDVMFGSVFRDEEDCKELHLRSRYYHSEMDSYQIKAGQKYKDLKKSIVIFVCDFDPFEENRSIYTFETMCSENPELILEDKRKTFFVNIHGDRTGVNEKAVNLLDYFKTGEPTDEFTGGLQKRVQEIRADDEWRTNYMTIEMKMDERFEDGKKIGKAESVLELLEEYGPIPQELMTKVMAEENMDTLTRWHKLAAKVASIEEFVGRM